MKTKIVTRSLGYLVSMGCLLGASFWAMAQDHAFSASGEAVVVSRFVWRGQRLTNDWSFQPSMTLGVGGFSFNAWGSMDMTAVNEGPGLLIPENPLATPGGTNDGLKGQFSEVDYTLSFGHSFEHVSFDFGSLFYTSPPRSSSVASTTELFGAIGFDSAPLAPSATVYVDVDEAMVGGGDPGVYVLIEAEQRIETGSPANALSGVGQIKRSIVGQMRVAKSPGDGSQRMWGKSDRRQDNRWLVWPPQFPRDRLVRLDRVCQQSRLATAISPGSTCPARSGLSTRALHSSTTGSMNRDRMMQVSR